MGDRLTQLQDAVDQVGHFASSTARVALLRSDVKSLTPLVRLAQLAQQFIACLHYVHTHHDLAALGPDDKIRDLKQDPDQREGRQPRLPSLTLPRVLAGGNPFNVQCG